MGSYHRIIALAFLAALTSVIYSNVLHGPFIYDDWIYIARNPQIRDAALLWPPTPRYLTYLSFAANYAAGGLDTFGFHLVNVAIHIINSALVFAICLLLFETPAVKDKGVGRLALPAALIASFLFATHPVQTQAVSYMTQRFASLAAMFYLLSLASYLKWRTAQGKWRAFFYAAALVSALAAQLSKETGFTLPAVIVLVELVFFRGPSLLARLRPLVPFVLAMLVVPALLFGPELLSQAPGPLVPEYGSSGFTRSLQLRDLDAVSRHDYMATQFRVMVTYFRLLVAPVGQTIDYDYPLYTSFLDPAIALSAIFVIAVFGLGVVLMARGRRSPGLSLLAGFGIVFFFMAISIESSVIPIIDVIYEHRLYLPSAGAAIFAGAALTAAFERLRQRLGLRAAPLAWAVAATVILAVPLSAATWSRNDVWKDEAVFWRDAVAKSPEKARVRNNLGFILYRKGHRAEGMAEFRRAAELEPMFADARFNLGTAYKDLGLMEEAIREFETAVRYQPWRKSARNNLGLSYYVVGRYDEAVEQFEAILKASPDDYTSRNSLGLALWKAGRPNEAAAEFRAAISINPGYEDAVDNLRYLEAGR